MDEDKVHNFIVARIKVRKYTRFDCSFFKVSKLHQQIPTSRICFFLKIEMILSTLSFWSTFNPEQDLSAGAYGLSSG